MTGIVVWFTGLPSSGKTCLARAVERRLQYGEQPVCLLDGDDMRAAIVPPPGYDDDSRQAFYTTLGNVAAVLASQGLIVLVAATADRAAFRDHARNRAGRFVEVFVDTPLEECRKRDAKGLYRDADEGRISGMPGVQRPYEAPERPDVVAHGGCSQAAVDDVLAKLWQEGLRGYDTMEDDHD